jgi:hypothetical protein
MTPINDRTADVERAFLNAALKTVFRLTACHRAR